MRNLGAPSEIRQLAAPVARLLDGAWQRMHWWIATMAVLYAVSGITVVKSDEVAVILRWGRRIGDTPALQQHGPGLLFAFPRPMDQVMRVQVKRVWEVPIKTLSGDGTSVPPPPPSLDDEDAVAPADTLDPLTQGYALTGDQNIVQLSMVARYRIKDPAEWALYGPNTEDIVRVEVNSAMVQSLGEMGVDGVLSDRRKDLIAVATQRAQVGLDKSHSGLELSSLELTHLGPPQDLVSEFDAVQSAFINAETRKKEAQAYAEQAIPEAQANANSEIQTANADANASIAQARGEAAAFLALEKEYRSNPEVVRERLYRDAVDQAFGGALAVRWLPPPAGGNYHGLRITLERP